MQRIMIVGQPGSGKSTLARELGRRTGLPVVHIDHIHWQPGWIERPRAEKTRLCHAVEAQERWIFEGGHSETWANRLARAEMLIWLDLPVGLRLWRVAKRTAVWHGRNRPDLPEGCPEGLHRESLAFWRFIWRTRRSAREGIRRLVASAPAGKRIVHLRSRAEIRRFLADWPAQAGAK
ncbi:AAA family ATPase [Xinfangfangia pollutisoli]|uniref:AAA family ATPase n=1 Tax=Xinfangfangia pollutisoli TaxID=2865960 RepID=UPI001CD5EC37|nr:AAA family ATPase [Xinfangfangia pollutisoli]